MLDEAASPGGALEAAPTDTDPPGDGAPADPILVRRARTRPGDGPADEGRTR